MFDSRTGFVICFESCTKQQQAILILSRFLYMVPKCAREKCYNIAKFWTRGRQGPIQLINIVVRRTHVRQTTREHDIEPKTLKMKKGNGGAAINLEKLSV